MNGDVKSAAALGPHVRVNRSAYRLSTFRDQYLKVGGPPLLSCPVLPCPVRLTSLYQFTLLCFERHTYTHQPRFGSGFSSTIVICGHCTVSRLCPALISETLKWLTSLPILMSVDTTPVKSTLSPIKQKNILMRKSWSLVVTV